MVSLINKEPLTKIDYVSIADQETLEGLSTINHTALVSLAVRIGGIRLIDNILFYCKPQRRLKIENYRIRKI